MQIESKQQIIERRKEIEQTLTDILQETDPTSPRLRQAGNNFTLEDVKELIYNEEDNDDFHKLIVMFDRGGDASELSNVLELVTDAWNYFPHKILDGISPAEKILKYKDKKS
jgi:hypothetical protein